MSQILYRYKYKYLFSLRAQNKRIALATTFDRNDYCAACVVRLHLTPTYVNNIVIWNDTTVWLGWLERVMGGGGMRVGGQIIENNSLLGVRSRAHLSSVLLRHGRSEGLK
jgi:hypothetical protein